ncbi:MAG: filamentous hemagglutinin N-terminal domain-containing protein, partial [Xenococcaceae cyanobacterium MO_234.B1]|nr:filamentous hemagglutinin N-terminal domain-containing protein [Xenococcaceae cyanobacterium MO_234.B1]
MAYGLSKFYFFPLFWLSLINLSQAQIVPDNTLPQNSIVNSDCNTSCQIEGGTTRNNNLFHSFDKFSVPPNVEAVFNHSPNIKNIFTRVTGRFPSHIEGTISTQIEENISNQGSANLFLINPNGIMFGANARLNIGGSFLATTADSVFFADNSQFSATNPQNSPLLTVSVPIGLQFGEKPGEIVNESRFEE